jgi:hypothetical protein
MMDKSMYKALAALYKEYEGRVQAISDEIDKRVREIDPEGKVCDFISPMHWVQLYADKPSEGAKFTHESDTGTKFYDSWFDGVMFVEMIENDKG